MEYIIFEHNLSAVWVYSYNIVGVQESNALSLSFSYSLCVLYWFGPGFWVAVDGLIWFRCEVGQCGEVLEERGGDGCWAESFKHCNSAESPVSAGMQQRQEECA